MKKSLLAAMALSMAAATGANAAVVVTSTGATDPYTGPAATFDFETPAPVTGGSIVTGNSAAHTTPFGSTGNYLSAGPITGNPAVIDLSSFSQIGSISFLWGSMDIFNLFELMDSANNVIFAIDGQAVKDLSAPEPTNINRVVTFTFTDLPTQLAVSGARLSSTQDAFEIDNFNVRAVPEPATWAMMLLGFFGLSFALRSRKEKPKLRVRYA